MPFGDEIISVNTACVDCRSQFLLLQPVIVHDSDFRLNLDFRQFSSAFHMYMNGHVFIQIEEEPQSKYPQQCRHSFIFSANIGIKIYISKLF